MISPHYSPHFYCNIFDYSFIENIITIKILAVKSEDGFFQPLCLLIDKKEEEATELKTNYDLYRVFHSIISRSLFCRELFRTESLSFLAGKSLACVVLFRLLKISHILTVFRTNRKKVVLGRPQFSAQLQN